MTYRVIICGSRKFNDYTAFQTVCNRVIGKFQWDNLATREEIEIVSGGATGADTLAERWAESQGLTMKVFEADWKNLDVPNVMIKTNSHGEYNVLAGMNRNQTMLDYALNGEKAIVISFYKGVSKGSKMMVRICKKSGMQHSIWDSDKKKMRK